MSGGAWGYLKWRLEEDAGSLTNESDDRQRVLNNGAEALTFLGAVEHELDWGRSGDTCLACAELRVVAALHRLFEESQSYGDVTLKASAAINIAQCGNGQTTCARCAEQGRRA